MVLTARLGYASVALLEILAGSWVSIFQYRKRMMCLLDESYIAQRGRARNNIVQLSSSLLSELWLLVCTAPLAVTDLRAESLGEIFLTDASEGMKAAVHQQVPLCFAREMQRHSLARGCWTRLLSPWKAWLQQHFLLEEENDLPDGVPLVSHPLWPELAQCLSFVLEAKTPVWKKRHINMLELEAILELERRLSRRRQDVRYLCGADSQISLAALLKGRSSSPRLRGLLQRSLPTCLGAGLYGNYGYIPSQRWR